MLCAAVYRPSGTAGCPPSDILPMRNPRYELLSKALLGSALMMLLLGLYFLFAQENFVVGGALIAVAVMDVGVAVLFARRSS